MKSSCFYILGLGIPFAFFVLLATATGTAEVPDSPDEAEPGAEASGTPEREAEDPATGEETQRSAGLVPASFYEGVDVRQVLDRIGLDAPVVRSFLAGRYSVAIDLGWRRIQGPAREDGRDDLFLILAESYFRVGENSVPIGIHARSIFRYGLNRFPASENTRIRLIRLGDVYREQGFLPEAEAYYEELLNLHPNDPATGHIYFRLGECYRRDEKWDRAIQVYRQAYNRTDDPAERSQIGLATARTLYEMGKARDAVRIYQQALAGPDDLRLLAEDDLYTYGRAHFDAGEKERSWQGFCRFEELYPDSDHSGSVLYYLGLHLLDRGSAAEARERFEAVRSSSPGTEEYFLATVRLAEGDIRAEPPELEDAARLLDECLEQAEHREPKREAQLLMAEVSFLRGQMEDALTLLDPVFRDVRDNPFLQPALRLIQRVFRQLTERYHADGRHHAVLDRFDEHRDNLINNLLPGETLDLIGRSELAKFRYAPCRELFSETLIRSRFPELSGFYLAMAEIEDPIDGAGDADLLRFLEHAEDLDLRARGFLALGDWRLREGEDETAGRYYRRALEPGVDDEWRARALLRLADRNLGAERYHSAYANYLRCSELTPPRRELGAERNIGFGIAESLFQLGRYGEALEEFRALNEAFPEDVRKHLARVRIAQCMVRTGETVADAIEVIAPVAGDEEPYARILDAISEEMAWTQAYRTERTN